MKKVKDLGEVGDIKEVADGFAINFLLPRSLAKKANKETLKWAENMQKERIAKKAEINKKAKEIADKLKKTTLSFVRKTTKKDGDKLFGAVVEKDIIEELKDKEKIELEKKQITMKHFKETGQFEAELHLSEEVNVKIKIQITAEK